MLKYYLVISVLSIFVIILIGIGIVDSGGPMATSGLKNDQKVISDFTNLDYAIEEYVTSNGKLPTGLSALTSNGGSVKITDSKTGKMYDYKPLNKDSYQLCAIFSADKKKLDTYDPEFYDGYDDYKDNNDYKKGYSCITYKVNSYAFDDYENDQYFNSDADSDAGISSKSAVQDDEF